MSDASLKKLSTTLRRMAEVELRIFDEMDDAFDLHVSRLILDKSRAEAHQIILEEYEKATTPSS